MLTLASADSFANSSNTGVSFSAGMGYPSAEATNPDGDRVFYSGIAAVGKLGIPIVEGAYGRISFDVNLRYLDMNNNSNTDQQRETGNHIGLAPGMEIRFFRFVFATNYYFTKARHYWVGDLDDFQEFDIANLEMNYGIELNLFKGISISFLHSTSTATISKEYTELDKDTPYKDSIFWLRLNFFTNTSIKQMLGPILK
jgi:hypothetical protein